MAWPKLDPWERAATALILAGLGLRAWALTSGVLVSDSAWYATMAESLVRHGEFLVPWVEGVQYTHHFPPLYPAFVALFFLPAGPSLVALAWANLVAAALFVGVVFLCTRDLYGRGAAFGVTVVAATLPTLVAFDRDGLGETLVAALFALTIWAILKSLDRPRFIVLAGAFAGLGYLAKASMGPFFILAGLAGFAWRFAYARWRVLRDPWYLAAVGVFALAVVPWAARNVLRHGWPHWETQPYADLALDALWARSGWPLLVLASLFWAAVLLAAHAGPFLVGAASARRDLRAERTSGLLLAVATPLVVAAFFVAAFSIHENWSVFRSVHPVRYAITPIVPLLWLSMRHLDWSRAAPDGAPTSGAERVKRERALLLAGAILLAGALAFRAPFFQSQMASQLLLLMGLSALGLAVLAVSRFFAWAPSFRKNADGSTSWRAVPHRAPRLALLAAPVLFVAAWLVPVALIPLLLGAAGASLARGPRAQVLVLGAIFLGWGLGGGVLSSAHEDAGVALAALAQPGDTLAVEPGMEPFVAAFVPEGVRMVEWEENATFRLRGGFTPADVPDYALVASFGRHAALGPAAALKVTLRESSGAEVAPPLSLHLYRGIH